MPSASCLVPRAKANALCGVSALNPRSRVQSRLREVGSGALRTRSDTRARRASGSVRTRRTRWRWRARSDAARSTPGSPRRGAPPRRCSGARSDEPAAETLVKAPPSRERGRGDTKGRCAPPREEVAHVEKRRGRAEARGASLSSSPQHPERAAVAPSAQAPASPRRPRAGSQESAPRGGGAVGRGASVGKGEHHSSPWGR